MFQSHANENLEQLYLTTVALNLVSYEEKSVKVPLLTNLDLLKGRVDLQSRCKNKENNIQLIQNQLLKL